MVNKAQINKILSVIAEKLQDINFAFIGSVNLYIQRLKVEPRDIDILTTPEGIKKIDKILDKYRTKEIYFDESDGRNSFRGFYEINGIEIEVLGNMNNLYREIDILDKKIHAKLNNIKLPCIALDNELEAYKKMGRIDKVEIIEKFLRAQG